MHSYNSLGFELVKSQRLNRLRLVITWMRDLQEALLMMQEVVLGIQ